MLSVLFLASMGKLTTFSKYRAFISRFCSFFSPFGSPPLLYILGSVPVDRQTGGVRGFAFVTMASGGSSALKGADGTEVGGREISVRLSEKKGGGVGGGDRPRKRSRREERLERKKNEDNTQYAWGSNSAVGATVTGANARPLGDTSAPTDAEVRLIARAHRDFVVCKRGDAEYSDSCCPLKSQSSFGVELSLRCPTTSLT